jgi:hypothetical protein
MHRFLYATLSHQLFDVGGEGACYHPLGRGRNRLCLCRSVGGRLDARAKPSLPKQIVMCGLIMNLSDNAQELVVNTVACCLILKVRGRSNPRVGNAYGRSSEEKDGRK